MLDGLYGRPDIYNQVYDRFTEDIAFYTDLGRRADGPVCELACGSGRVTVPMALAGLTVHGVDLSAEMLAAAVRRARDAGITVGEPAGDSAGSLGFSQGDMRDPLGDDRFGLITIPLHSLSHLHDTSDVMACLRGVRRSLKKGGRLAFAVHNPDPAVLARDSSGLFRIHPELSSAALYESSRYDAARQLLHLSWFVETMKNTERFSYTLRMFFPQEMVMLLECSGLVLEHRYGWYDRNDFTADSGSQVIVARRW